MVESAFIMSATLLAFVLGTALARACMWGLDFRAQVCSKRLSSAS